MKLRKITNVLIIAVLIFVVAIFFIACSENDEYSGNIDQPGNVTLPDDGDNQQNPPDLDIDDSESNLPNEPEVPNPDPVAPEPDVPAPAPGEPEVPETPSEPEPPSEMPEPEVPDVEPEEPDVPTVPEPDVPTETPKPDKPIEPDPTEPDEPLPPITPNEPSIPNIYNYMFCYGLEQENFLSETATSGEVIDAPIEGVDVQYYDFVGWQVDGEIVEFPYTIVNNITFIALYRPTRFPIIYELNGGLQNIRNPIDYTIETTELLLHDIERLCYDFDGWYLDKAFTDRIESIIVQPPYTIVFYAKWTNPYHSMDESHACVFCGAISDTRHVFNHDHKCEVCDIPHEKPLHEYNIQHICEICGYENEILEHNFDSTHFCEICDYKNPQSDHEFGEDYHCQICGDSHPEKAHTYDKAHCCSVCGKPAASLAHTYNDDYFCTICGIEFTGIRPWKGDIAGKFNGGNGTQITPFEISNGAELAYLAELINKKESDESGLYSEKHYVLTSDIDLGGREWTPIGKGFYSSEYSNDTTFAFKGSFNGNAKTISNYVIKNPKNGVKVNSDANIYYAAGLFGIVCDGNVCNLKITDFVIDIYSSEKNTIYNAGGIVGTITALSSVSNCVVNGSITLTTVGGMNIGLAIGFSDADSIGASNVIEKVCAYGDLFGSGGAQIAVGGLVGRNGNSSVNNCYADVTVIAESTATAYGAGFIGYYRLHAHLNFCYAMGSVNVTGKIANADGFLNKPTSISEKWISDCMRVDTQTIIANGKPTEGKTTVKKASAEVIAAAASELIGK